MTLVEVVAALVVLGTLLAMLTASRSRSLLREAGASERLVATRLLQPLLDGWLADGSEVPVGAAGVLDAQRGLRWQTRRLPNPAAEGAGCWVVRVSVLKTGGETSRTRPVLEIDLLARDPAVEPDDLGLEPDDGEDPATAPSIADPRSFEDPRLDGAEGRP